MKSFLLFTLTLVIGNATAHACSLEIDGKQIAPQTLKQGEATVTNETGNGSVAITCGAFGGTLEGLGRIVRLNIGECTVVSNQSTTSLFECAE